MSPLQSPINLSTTSVIPFSMPPWISPYVENVNSTSRVHDHVLPSSLLKLCEYDTEVEALENTLTNLKKGHASLAHSIQVYKPYLAPIRRLPVELLRKFSRKHVPFLLFALTGEVFAYLCRNSGPSCLLMPTKFLLPSYQERVFSKLTTIGISVQVLQKFWDTIGMDDDDDIPLTCL
ncbi:hypothetical protein IW261DRAFT_1578499 [Armillaria novae-zelandiae]|uniref:Uncharacterized protein n=1 Tax=Armillaria novae-zelandiae TaxID=153914 RepID=A0AA39N6R8_9AGAR|nr:hypothetical protein IW261DRAFT_1578499 [Armillaria novae-zelandiae]